jgi:two-component system, chemotaxis family, chemotaxis protein CheY
MSRIRVVCVDDSPFIHKQVAKALSPEVFEICGTALDGREGVNMCNTLKPDVVIMDITMPIMDGLDAAEAILGQNPGARIIMMSAMGDEELMERAKNIGVCEFIQKPFKKIDLPQVIQKIAGEG